MTDDIKRTDTSSDTLANEPHLDFGSLADIAQWVLAAAATGTIGNTAHAVLRSVATRSGKRGVDELHRKVLDELKRVKQDPNVSEEDLQLRVEKLFSDYDK